MKYMPIDPPRCFSVGLGGPVELKDCARLEPEPDEQVTFVTESGREFDVVRKSWGYYATPSLNHRLRKAGLRGVLVRNRLAHYFVLLVERDREGDFASYCDAEQLSIVSWLDRDEALTRLEESLAMSEKVKPAGELGCPCGRSAFHTVHIYDAPPDGETRFGPGDCRDYRRDLRRCEICAHFISVCDFAGEALYSGSYVDATYGSDGIRREFERVISLGPDESDNKGRAARVIQFAQRQGLVANGSAGSPTVLDIGSGIGVFPHAMKSAGWQCTALDPDERAYRHAREVVGVEAVCADFYRYETSRRWDLVTFNKVLEHALDPVAMLARSRCLLTDRGFVYLELPDGEAAITAGPEREEFFIEHLHAFSMASMVLLARRAGFLPVRCERLREPSGKFTLYAFLLPK